MSKKILMIGMNPDYGGVESYIMNILRNARKDKFCFYFPKCGITPIAYEEEIRSLGGIILEDCPGRHEYLRYIPFYRKLFRDYRFDAVYLNTCDIMSYDMLIFAKQAGVPVRIIHSHSSENMIAQSLYHKLSEKWCRANVHRYATHYLACGDQAGKWMFATHPFTVIQNGISTERFHFSPNKRAETRAELGIENAFVVGFVGRLSAKKNPKHLVSVFAEFSKHHPYALLLIVGDGELHQETAEYISTLGLHNRVKLLGVRSDIPELMCAMDCLCLPSDFEGFPFVLVEAQACGLPCVVSRNVSEECNLTGNMRFVGLDEPIANWVAALSSAEVSLPREQYAEEIRRLGYDMKSTVLAIENMMDPELC